MAKLDTYAVEEWPELVRKAHFRADELATALQVSPRSLSRYIHRRFGCTVEDWLDGHRMADAPQALKRIRRIKEASSFLGYHHPRTFSDKFERRYGMHPVEFLARSDRAAFLRRPTPIPEASPPKPDAPSKRGRKRG